MRVATLLSTLVTGAALVTASACKPSAPSSVSSVALVSTASSSSSPSSSSSSFASVTPSPSSSSSSVSSASSSSSSVSAAPSPATGPGGCTYYPTVNLLANHLDLADSIWTINSGGTYGDSYGITTCNSGPANDCVVFTAMSSFTSSYYIVSMTLDLASTEDGSGYMFQFDASQNNDKSNALAAYTLSVPGLGQATLDSAGAVQTVQMSFTANGAATTIYINASPVYGSSIVTLNSFALYQTSCSGGN